MKKLILFISLIGILLATIFALNINKEEVKESKNEKPETTYSSNQFVGDTGYNIDENLDIPKITFIYSDPTPHHPNG